jgi:peptide/nickel transport system substrate-binding protein
VKKAIIVPILVLLIAILTLSACSQSTPTPSATKPAATTAAPASSAPAASSPAPASKPATSAPASSAPASSAPASSAAAGQPKLGGTLKLSRFTADGVNLGDPLKHAGMNSWFHSTPALETLLRADEKGILIPWLATAWKEDAANKSVTLTIRQGVKFSDGTDLNAEAVKWNLQHLVDGKHPAAGSFASVDVVDANNVKITLKQWDSTVLGNLSGDAGQIISPTAYQKNGADAAANLPVGTGPFILNKWDKGSLVSYDKNPNYWIKGQPYLDKLQWVVIPDMNAKALSFQNKELDVILTVDIPQIKQLTAAGYKTLHQTVGSGADGYVFASGEPNSPWAKLEVRQAAQYAFNTAEYTTALFGDEAAPTNQFVGKSSWAYNPDVVGYPYNPDKAKQLLAQAGYPNGFKSVINGSQDQTFNKRALAIQEYMRKVGINLDVNVISDAQAREISTQGKSWEGLHPDSLGTSTDVVDTFSRYYTGGGLMFKSMATPDDWVKAVQDAKAAPDFATKQKLTQNLQKLFVDKYCLILISSTRYDNAFEQSYVRNSGVLRSANTQIWTPEAAWLDK